jgi:hypothetical protein
MLPILPQKNSLCYKVRKLSPKVKDNDIKKWQASLPFFENGRKIYYNEVELNFLQGSSFFSAPNFAPKNSLCYKVRKCSPKVKYNDIKKWQAEFETPLDFSKMAGKIYYKKVELNLNGRKEFLSKKGKTKIF